MFEPLPSQKDMENQRNYQALTRDDGSGLEPFLGFIMGPYDLAMPQPISAVTAFVVQHKAGLLQPYGLRWVEGSMERGFVPKRPYVEQQAYCARGCSG